MEKNKKSYIMDMDGVVYAESKLIEGAKEFIYTLQKNRNKFLFLTNNSRQTPLDLSKKLAILGIKVGWERIFTSAIATAMFLNKQKSEINYNHRQMINQPLILRRVVRNK